MIYYKKPQRLHNKEKYMQPSGLKAMINNKMFGKKKVKKHTSKKMTAPESMPPTKLIPKGIAVGKTGLTK